MTTDDFLELKKLDEEMRRQKDKVAGAYGEIKKRLRTKYGSKTLAQAKARLKQVLNSEVELEKELDASLENLAASIAKLPRKARARFEPVVVRLQNRVRPSAK